MDPNNIRFNTKYTTVTSLLETVPATLNVDITREDMTALIELLLVNGPMPHVSMRIKGDGTVECLGAGAKFVSVLRAFANGARLGETTWIPEWSGKCLSELEVWVQRRFHRREVTVMIIEPGTTDAVADAVFSALARG